MKKRVSSRQTKALDTRAKIYKSAEELFKEHQFDNVSVDAIVEKAGVAKGSFYVHFKSKDALIASLMADHVAKLDLNYRAYLESFPPGTPASEILIAIVGKIADIMTDYVGHDILKITYETLLSQTVNADSIMGYNRDLYKMFSAIIDKGMHQAEFRSDKSADTIARHCILAIRGLTFEWCIRYPDFNLKDEVQNHFILLLDGIKKREENA